MARGSDEEGGWVTVESGEGPRAPVQGEEAGSWSRCGHRGCALLHGGCVLFCLLG